MAILMGMGGVLLGILLFGAGAGWAYWLLNRKVGRPPQQAAAPREKWPGPAGETARQWQELANFLSYDGSPQPDPRPAGDDKGHRADSRKGRQQET